MQKQSLIARGLALIARYRERPHREEQISERQAILITGLFSAMGFGIIILVVRYLDNFEPLATDLLTVLGVGIPPYAKAGSGLICLILGFLMIFPHVSVVSALGHIGISAGIGLILSSGQANELIDSSVDPVIESVIITLVPVWAISLLFPFLLETFVSTLAGIIIGVAVARFNYGLSTESVITGVSVTVGVIWSWQEMLSQSLTVDSAIDASAKTYLKVIQLYWRRILSVSYRIKTKMWLMKETMSVIYPKGITISVKLEMVSGETRNLGPFISFSLDLTGKRILDQKAAKIIDGVLSIEITSDRGDMSVHRNIPDNKAYYLAKKAQ